MQSQCSKEFDSLDNLPAILEKAAEGMQFHEAIITFYKEDGKLGSRISSGNNETGETVILERP